MRRQVILEQYSLKQYIFKLNTGTVLQAADQHARVERNVLVFPSHIAQLWKKIVYLNMRFFYGLSVLT